MRPLGLILSSAVLLMSCGNEFVIVPRIERQSPAARCEALLVGPLAGDPVRLVAAYESTASEIALWQEGGHVPGGGRAGPGMSPLRSHPSSESIASCYFDGGFTFRGPLPPGAAPPSFERMLFLIDSAGHLIQVTGGTKALLPLVRPAP